MEIEKGKIPSSIRNIDPSFRNYVNRRKQQLAAHIAGNGLPDYAFSVDYELRKKLDSIPQFYNVSKNICATYASRTLQIINQSALAVGPNQLPEVYDICRECAKRLGIGIPSLYILDSRELNAYTIATDDIEPLIVVHSSLYERFSKGELKAVIGHECGHIHNSHGVYNIMAQILMATGVNTLAGTISSAISTIVSLGANYALKAWYRAEEVTCDRAGMICCDHLEDCYSVMAKFMHGAMRGDFTISYEELEKQLDMQKSTITRLEELERDHPSSVRRIQAERAFSECELFYRWRPDLRTPGQTLYSKHDTDEKCRQYVSVLEK